MVVRIYGAVDHSRVAYICINHYNCEPHEFVIGEDSVEVLHHTKVDDMITTKTSSDAMSLIATFIPAINGGKKLTYEEAFEEIFPKESLAEKFAEISSFKNAYNIMNDEMISQNVVVARGRRPQDGIDATINLFFDHPSIRPLNESTTKINFKDINKYVNVKADQLLATITPASQGFPGLDLNGKQVPQRYGRPVELNARDGVKAVEYGFYAEIDGFVVYRNHQISVSQKLEVNGNVDFTTGNIDFLGDIEIKGDVMSGFTVKGRDVTISGVVQDSQIAASRNVFVKYGIRGENSSISSDGDITLGYGENATLRASGSITIQRYAFNCKMFAGNVVNADDRTTITGGSIVTFAGGSFYNVGTKINPHISIHTGRMFDAKLKISELKGERAKLLDSLDKIKDVYTKIDLENPEIAANLKVQKIIETKDLIIKRINLLNEQVDSLLKTSICRNPIIEVRNELEYGATLKFFDTSLAIEILEKKVRYRFDSENMIIKKEKIV